MPQSCSHADMIDENVVPSSADTCPECVALGDTWVHLRVCLVCGQVGCCDNSKNRHARRHYEASGHPLIQSYQPREIWRYCFVDDVLLPPGKALRKA